MIAMVVLLAGCSEKNPAMRIASYGELYVPIHDSSIQMLGGPVWKAEPGMTKYERDNIAYMYIDTLVDRSMLPCMMVYTSRVKVPSGMYYRVMRPHQICEEFMKLSYPLAIVMDPIVGAPNRDVILRKDIRDAARRIKNTDPLPLQIARAD